MSIFELGILDCITKLYFLVYVQTESLRFYKCACLLNPDQLISTMQASYYNKPE